MTSKRGPNPVSDALAAPLGDLIAAVGRGLSEAQEALDLGTAETLKRLYAGDDANMEMLRRLGYQPTWYRIPEVDAEITVSLTISGEQEQAAGASRQGSEGAGVRLYVAPMDASYTNRYEYDLNAASTIKFRVVAVPPSTQAAEMKVVPRLDGVAWDEARRRLRQLDIPFEVPTPAPREDERVLATSPDAGEFLAREQTLRITFDRR